MASGLSLAKAIAFALSTAIATPVAADGLAGAYLAARIAGTNSDFAAAVQYYARAVVRDPKNPDLLEGLIISQLALGDPEAGVPVARRLLGLDLESQIAEMLMLAYDLKTQPDKPPVYPGAGELISGLSLAWYHVGEGRMSDALSAFDTIVETRGLKEIGLYHKALALALVGDLEGADAIFSGKAAGPIRATRRGIIAHAEVLSQLERHDDALALLNQAFPNTADPEIVALRDKLSMGTPVPFDTVTSALDGQAEVFYSLAAALQGDANDSLTLIYARLATYLRSDHIDAILLSAGLLEALDQHVLATAEYGRVPADAPTFYVAEIGRADALDASGKPDAGIEVLQSLAKTHGQVRSVHVSLGDALRRQARYAEATRAYDRAIELINSPVATDWVVYYARGITYEREKNWARAEADFLKALDLRKDQPLVLNYLGYSYVERGEKLDKALGMIQRAVNARPNDGYIADSLGWVLYRLGRYDEAVGPMERAVQLTPIDPVINDHLGDVYWAVGRTREAEFQWKRALSFDPEEKELERIRRKLEVGLDMVLEEEGTKPLTPANGG